MTDSPRSNDGQVKFWASGPGSKWAQYQHGLDACLDNINNLVTERAEIKPGTSVLDIGCGTGATSLGIAAMHQGKVEVTGVDVSPPLLDLARKRANEKGLSNVNLLLADVQDGIPIDTQFDQAISRFGVMFFSEPVLAFGNIRRALKPGAQLTFVAWGNINQNPWFSIPRDAAIAQVGEGSPQDPKAPGPTAFSDLDYVGSILEGAGFTDIEISEEKTTIDTDLTTQEIIELACSLGPAVRLLNEQNGSREDQLAVREGVARDFQKYHNQGRWVIPVSLVICHGRNG